MSSMFPSERFSLKQVARDLEVHISTLWRWTQKGVRGKRLETIVVGGRRYVQRVDLERFINEGRPLSDSPDRNQRADNAGRFLDALGVRPRNSPATGEPQSKRQRSNRRN